MTFMDIVEVTLFYLLGCYLVGWIEQYINRKIK